jgi:hypothetical protein
VSRHRHSHARLRVVDQVLSNNQAGLDGFPKADFVCQEVALYWIGENTTDCSNLVGGQFDTCRDERRHSLSGAAKVHERYNGRLTAIMEKLALRAAAGQYFCGIIGRAPRAYEKENLAEIRPFPVGKPYLVFNQPIFANQEIGYPADTKALVVANIDTGLRAQVSAAKSAYGELDDFRSDDRPEDGNGTGAPFNRFYLAYAPPVRQ